MPRVAAPLVVTLLLGSVASAQTGAPPGRSGPAPHASHASGLPRGRTSAKAPSASAAVVLPAAPVRLRVVAPSPRGQWLLRLDNEGEQPVVVSADVRLLRLAIHPWDEKLGEYAKKPIVCDGPAAFGLEDRAPFGRELVLERGQAYVEAFDPRLICFGKQAEFLRPGVAVMPTYGFVPSARSTKAKAHSLDAAPFVADTAAAPRTLAPRKRLETGTLLLEDGPPALFPTSDPSPSAGILPPPAVDSADSNKPLEPAPYQTPKDELAAAMTLTTDRFADAASWRDVAFEVEAHNVGERPLWAALRARQVSFVVHGVEGETHCPRVSQDHHVPRDMFEELPGGKHRHIPVRLAEPCSGHAFQRPGLYAVVPTLHADDNGGEYGIVALTGTVSTRDPGMVGGTHLVHDDATLVRVRSGPLPFYLEPPRALPAAEADRVVPVAMPAASPSVPPTSSVATVIVRERSGVASRSPEPR